MNLPMKQRAALLCGGVRFVNRRWGRWVLLFFPLAAGCGSDSTTSDSPGGDQDAAALPDAPVDSAPDSEASPLLDAPSDNDTPDASASTSIEFQPSNIPLAAIPEGGGDCVIDEPDCLVDTDKGEISCLPKAAYTYAQVDQLAGGLTAAVFVCETLRVDSSAVLKAIGPRAVVLVGRTSVQVIGTIDATATRSKAVAGGFPTMSGNQQGGGPGGGAAASTQISAGGGGFCGRGGDGAAKSGDPGGGGTPFGTAEIVPLHGGSGGGSNFYGGGAGGGAIQLLSGGTISVEFTGVISAGGGGGSGHEGTSGGGGSGGAILLEAPTVLVAGLLAVNGGGGGEAGGGADGADATASTSPAPGAGTSGGDGSAGTDIDGASGVNDAGNIGGGGGGAGRIRINGHAGGVTVTGNLSPAATTPCVTIGKLGE